MRISSFDKILRHAQRHHLMLLYDDEDDRNSAEIQCINKALAEGQYCIYATVNSSDGDFLSRLTRLIPNYDKHVEEGNLEIVNFMPFYESAAKGDLTLFREMKRRVETELEGRMAVGKGRRVLLVPS